MSFEVAYGAKSFLLLTFYKALMGNKDLLNIKIILTINKHIPSFLHGETLINSTEIPLLSVGKYLISGSK